MKLKRIFLSLLICMTSLVALSQEKISLPKPNLNIDMTLIEALQQRHSTREFFQKAIDDNTLSIILWAACGINRPESGHITAPSAINAQDIIVFVCRENGAWQYEPNTHSLVKVTDKDLRIDIAGFQTDMAKAPIMLILASDHKRFGDRQNGASRMGTIDSGYVSENISLICTALNLNTVPRMTMNSDNLKRELKLDETFDLLINHPISYPKDTNN